jgi:hypothetical protein
MVSSSEAFALYLSMDDFRQARRNIRRGQHGPVLVRAREGKNTCEARQGQ